jgi:hypothetical protein
MTGPPLTGRLLAQAAGSFVTGSSLPQALIQRRQRLTYNLQLRLRKLVILSWSARQPAAGDSAVAQATTAVFTRLVRAPELTGKTPSRQIPLHRDRLHAKSSHAEQRGCARLSPKHRARPLKCLRLRAQNRLRISARSHNEGLLDRSSSPKSTQVLVQ